jgi:cellulose synthase/poly-beta-1,6-N-acetylglucosamine synthase-like glycosyltransferase
MPQAQGEARETAHRRGLTPGQWLFAFGLIGALVAMGVLTPDRLGPMSFAVVQIGFAAVGIWRALLIIVASRPDRPPVPQTIQRPLPRYSILVALHDEAAVVPQLIRRLSRIDYPADRLQGMLLLEGDDAATLATALTAERPAWLEVVVVPDGKPRTKPRALNHGLELATGDLITIYDAEDEPHPMQLRETAALFDADEAGKLGCVQAPLRIRPTLPEARFGSRFLGRHFAIEYGSLFDVALPAMARLDLPFPLGGTSNHFRADALRSVGGWDAWNVTEDADLGFALHRAGWQLTTSRFPTYESAPPDLHSWLPQRTRWLKGFLQTLLVHTRSPWGLGWRGALALGMTIAAPLASAATHAASLAALLVLVIVPLSAGLAPSAPVLALGVLSLGVTSAWATAFLGARRARASFGPGYLAASPVIWALTSLAFYHALWRLVREPFAWDKTAHAPDPDDLVEARTPAETGPDHAKTDKALRIAAVSD